VTDRISVLLVDDHALVRRGFRRLLEDDPAIVVVGEAGDGDTAIGLAELLKPRVVIMDFSMPGIDGVTATRRILERSPGLAILMLTMHGDPNVAQLALQAGARGYLLKSAEHPDLAQAVRRVAAGEIVVDAHLARAPTSTDARAYRLSPRQLQVLQLICNGLSNPAIAAELGVSVHTVAVHRAGIMKTLNVHRAGELVAYAIRHRLVQVP
jgi:DNA-binding NarL/FixJ family response regulator